ncbi:hypothetical protein TPHA_0I00930 [Tetrapisispora phaffii CBS 4417]|uniref:Cation/H+ exchanger transmembrane domain-containing protein n=1 Tax=Tetrapisispora phaffii (strain ATCC 24235 / CBS 4417 / NBRC 1672 / NRRL Y-8282 / UCD 70-5) TaxID=1071381 RepID=G8BXH1_TETPH|nr:hypothetical protein TPHA_0I00930 [Tetrapisispora phaffii CBS 4417]CCE64599.1 hypothetical protein TPHA_0I00930 [Tetrapisispora phaffii CBS 4417]
MSGGQHIGGVLSGVNPFHYNTSSPITLFLFQACLILLTCNLLHFFIAKLRQPKVISEVIAGVILGPTVLGQIPNYLETIFPDESIVGLNLTSNLGIILFMFFLGLEVDIDFIKKHIKTACSIGLVSLAVPFGCGCLIAIPLFHTYANQDPSEGVVKFTVFMVFIAVSISVTAFPVLCRILNELRLIKDRAGIVVLAAGIINDILGWVLLALSVILSNSESSPVNTVYILLCTLGWFLLYAYPVKYILRWMLIRFHELDRPKPSTFATMCILFLMFISAYFTDIIGVHPIFGAFIAGLIVPRENNYVIKLVERMEDIPNIILIPIYFAVAGLNVDLTLLNEGKDWGYVFATIFIAIGAKVISGTVMSKLHGLYFKEAAAVGVLMSCKGIVEIVVLTVGLNAGIITKKIFGMFILMALVSTFVTTPLTQLIYTDEYRVLVRKRISQQKLQDEKMDSEIPIIEVDTLSDSETDEFLKLKSFENIKDYKPRRIVNIINSAECISANLDLLTLVLGGRTVDSTSKKFSHVNLGLSRKSSMTTMKSKSYKLRKLISHKDDNLNANSSNTIMGGIIEHPSNFDEMIPLKAVHLRLLTERTTDLLQSSTFYNDDPDFTANTDALIQIYDIVTRLSKIPFTSEVVFSTLKEKATNIISLDAKNSDIMLMTLKGASFEHRNNPLVQEQYGNFEHIYSHILGCNELPSHFFNTLATSLKTNVMIHISNNGGMILSDRFRNKCYNLLLSNPYLCSSDYLAIYTLVSICHREIKDGNIIDANIFMNSKIPNFSENLHNLMTYEAWFDESIINIVPIEINDTSDKNSSDFIDLILQSGTIDMYNLEESTFIIPEIEFSINDPFSFNVKSLILHGANKKFNVVVSHYNNQQSSFTRSDS